MKVVKMKGMLSLIIALAVIIASTVIVASSINFYIETSGDAQNFNQGKILMSNLDAVVRELMFESKGATRDFSFNLKQGFFHVDGNNNLLKLTMEADVIEPGTIIKEGNVIIKRRPFVDAYDGDPDNDDENDLVMENDFIMFSVKEIGSNESHVDIGTKDLIIITNKFTNTTIKPEQTMLIDMTDVSSGTGYTEFLNRGSDLEEASIRLFMNSTIDYEAVFTLKAGHDFVEVEVRPME